MGGRAVLFNTVLLKYKRAVLTKLGGKRNKISFTYKVKNVFFLLHICMQFFFECCCFFNVHPLKIVYVQDNSRISV